ncbi:reticulon-4a isoform X5 [Brachyistius frenatus]|uniref:reticulon-4a isoform X5 n=1 Tax=Brachyistius frenatus TaxID=100188 RepID=UPI0037E74782
MADNEEQQVSSSTSLFNEAVHHYQAEPEPEPAQDLFSVDDIVDLVGGAQDALERHIAEDRAPTSEETVTLLEPEPVHIPEPEPVHIPEPQLVHAPQSEPEPAPEVKAPEPEAVPDSTSFSFVPEVVAPRTEPEPRAAPRTEPEPRAAPRTEPEPQAAPRTEPEPRAAPEPEPAPASDALPAAEPRTAAAEAAERPAVTEAALVDLLYWRDVKTTGVVFGAALLLLLSLTVCSIVSVCSYIGLALLSVTVCFRIYKGILQAIQKSDEGHPFKQYLDQEVALSEDTVHKYSDVVLAKINKIIGDLRRLFLVEDLVDSIKFAVLMWILTYVGAFFNGLTILILGVIAMFSCPIVYEKHQAQIDHYVTLVNNQVKDVVGKIQAKVPGMKRKTE